MTRGEIVSALEHGHKITHNVLHEGHYIYMAFGTIYDEDDNFVCSFDEAIQMMTQEDNDPGWKVI